jgi:hypothetical protein
MRDVAPHGHARSEALLLLIHCNSHRPEDCNDRSRKYRRKEHLMLDVVMLVLGLGFFALSVGYAYACERL